MYSIFILGRNLASDGISSTEKGSDVLTVEGNNVVQLSEPDVMLQQVQLEQQKDPELARLIDYMTDRTLPSDPRDANIVVGLSKKGYYVVDNVLYYEGSEVGDHRCVVVPNRNCWRNTMTYHLQGISLQRRWYNVSSSFTTGVDSEVMCTRSVHVV